MAAMNMKTVTEYLERSLQNCSLDNVGDGLMREESDEHIPISDGFLELNSHTSIPSHFEQFLDLQKLRIWDCVNCGEMREYYVLTGEIYYINCNNGMRVKEDPRKSVSSNDAEQFSGESYGSVFSEEDRSYYESEESSSESSLSSRENRKEKEEEVLVVGGCKACFMYFMVPKFLQDCPKCAAQLLHFASP